MAEKKTPEENRNHFAELYAVNVNDKTEKKNGLTYLSWAWAYAEFLKVYPDAVYEIVKFDGIPYAYDPITGFMVYTRITAGGITREMWLPVMDRFNKAMKAAPYQWKDRYNKPHTVDSATMFDVNKTIMRCLTKNLAMFGLGLYIYAGEDLPEDASTGEQTSAEKRQPTSVEEACSMLTQECNEHQVVLQKVAEKYGITNESPLEDIQAVLAKLRAHYGQ